MSKIFKGSDLRSLNRLSRPEQVLSCFLWFDSWPLAALSGSPTLRIGGGVEPSQVPPSPTLIFETLGFAKTSNKWLHFHHSESPSFITLVHTAVSTFHVSDT